MNRELKNWTTSQAFVLAINQRGIENILTALEARREGERAGMRDENLIRCGIKMSHNESSYLVRRGLVVINELDEYSLTMAGVRVGQLLEEAGFTNK